MNHATTPSQSCVDHFMVLPVPMRLKDGVILFEKQACNGLDRWCDSFDSLLVASPVMPESVAAGLSNIAWADVKTIPSCQKIEMLPLPWAFTPVSFAKHYRTTRNLLRRSIDRSRYLHFGIGGLFGDWAAVASEQAIRAKRPFAVHLDRVEDELIRRTFRNKPLLARWKANGRASLMQRWHRRLIERASLVMCHGYDTYATYRAFNDKAFVIHNIHTTAADQATAQQIDAKIRRLETAAPMRISYAGRADPEKAPMDWLTAIHRAINAGVDLHATWIGDGAQFREMRDFVATQRLQDRIELPGFISDRSRALQTIRDSDLFVFTHITPESPRCLIEALISATPIVGYESHYAADLIRKHAGGRLTPIYEANALGDTLIGLSRDRAEIARLVRQAADDGRQFTSQAVFHERSELIKEYLPASLSHKKRG